MTLTEFLLARIDDDEANAINVTRFEIRDGIPGSYVIKDRVLAECEAKRRIVAWASDGEGEFHWASVLGPLAVVYADHPDYDESWRP